MLTCKSPKKVMWAAFCLARESLPEYSSKFSRKDFTLPQLFACLAVKEFLRRSYRGAEALLADCEHWCAGIGMAKVPDHNTLCRAAAFLLRTQVPGGPAAGRGRPVGGAGPDPGALDQAAVGRQHHLRVAPRQPPLRAPLRHETRRRLRAKERARKGRKSTRAADTVRRLPKLGLGVATHCHLALSLWAGTGGGGSDHPHFEPVVFGAWRRVPNRRFKVAADAGYDSEANHRTARRDMGLPSLIPPDLGRPRKDGGPPGGRWRRRHMRRLLATKAGRKRSGYTHRWQGETVNGMMKRNLGSALAGKTAWSRKRDMYLKTLVHDLMVL